MFQFLAVVLVVVLSVVRTSAASEQLLRLPFPAGEEWIVTCGYGCGFHKCGKTEPVICGDGIEDSKDAFALDFTTLNGCGGSWGKPVLAVADGVVVVAKTQVTCETVNGEKKCKVDGYGNYVVVDEGDGYRSVYAHLSSFSVEIGDVVVQGQELGRVGNTGSVSKCAGEHPGAHIHYARWQLVDGELVPVRPEPMSGYTGFPVGDGPFLDFPLTSDNDPTLTTPDPPASGTVTAGQFKPGEPADDNISQAFRVEYARWTDSATGFNKLGAPDPDVYYPYVIEYVPGSGIYLQQFHQPDPNQPRFIGGPAGTDGWTRLVYGKTTGRAYVVSPIFLAAYFDSGQPVDQMFGAPLNNEHIWTGPSDLILPGYNNYIRQDFSLGKTMIAQAVAAGLPHEVRVIDTPPGPLHISIVDGVGGSEPFTLSGWAVSNTQVALTCRGNLEIDANGHFAWLRDGVEVSTTALPEFTELNLTPGATYTYSVQAVDDVWGVVDVSNDLTLTLSPQDEFSLHVELKQANAVSISVVNHRFAVVGYYVVNRDGVPITRLTGEACGDYDLDYSRTYTYEVVAMTASHMELGRTGAVTLLHSRECDNDGCSAVQRSALTLES